MGLRLKMVHKLFLAIFGGIAITLFAMSVLVYWNVTQGFLNYVNKVEIDALSVLEEPLLEEFSREGSWVSLQTAEWRWRKMIQDFYNPQIRHASIPSPEPVRAERPRMRRDRAEPGVSPPGPRNPPSGPRRPNRMDPGQRIMLSDANGQRVLGPRNAPESSAPKILRVNGETVGFLSLVPRKNLTEELDRQFLKSQWKVLAWVILLLLGCAMGISILLARHWGGRLQRLERGAYALSLGRFETRLPEHGHDELASVARNFNNLAHTLAENELARQRMTADISHELRTPLAIFKGELEALQDGVRTYRPELVESLLSEVRCLTKLVEDLYELSRADLGGLGYRKTRTNGLSILQHVIHGFEEGIRQADLVLELDLPQETQIMLFADPDRLFQLFSNVLANSIKYTDPGGKIRLTCDTAAGIFKVVVEDSPPGLPPDQLEAIFAKFYRGSHPTQSSSKGSGLGLAICRKIVQAHEGTISAATSRLGGLAIQIGLPLEKG